MYGSADKPTNPTDLTISKDMTEWVMEFAEKHNRPLIAVSAAKYLDREENTEWKMLQDYSYHDGETGCLEQDVTAHLRSAGEMMELFSFLGNKKAREIVIDNPKMLVEQIELHEPFVNDRIYPVADGDSQKLRAIVFSNAKKLYGEILPAEVSVRIEKELSGICEAGHDPIFLFVEELMEKAGILDEPHGFRSSSNNSFVAYLCGITTLNPLKPHYRCVECQYSDFETDALDAAIGYRLPNKSCPVCGTELIKDGFSLPYKFFLGMDGGKVPDFDLNVRPSVQKEVWNMVSSLSGVKESFHAGTISTIGRRRAENIIDSYCSKFHFQLEEWEYDAYADELAGCARGYGLHPGKMLIFPKNKGEVTEHLPLRLMGGDVTTGIDFHQIDGLLYGIDILALDLLELLYGLEKRTGCPVSEIDFAGRSVLKDIPKDRDGCFMLNGMAGFEGLSARQMVQKILSVQDDIDFWDFVKIHGLMHGTGVWTGNADSLLQRGHSLDEVIATREDCFDFFYRHGMDGKTAYRIAEDVRKGKAGQDSWLDKWGQILRKHDIPEWYIDSCRKIRFLFPRGHCITYAQLYWQLLYYKANYPEDFYQCFFEIYADSEDKEIIAGGKTVIKAVLSKFAGSGNENDDVPRYDHNISVLKTALEMYEWKEMAKQA